MIYSTKSLLGKKIQATNEDFGTCKDLYFDDESFHIRYLVIDTGNWLPGRRVLLSPQSIDSVNMGDLKDGIPVTMTREQIEKSPPMDADKPVSRQAEERLHVYYGWQPYWLGDSASPLYAGVPPIPTNTPPAEMPPPSVEEGDPNLRSLREVCGYSIRPADSDSSGPLHDLLVDAANWTVKFAVVNTRPWFIGSHKVIPINTVKYVDYDNSEIGCTYTKEQIKGSPSEPSDTHPISVDEELKLQKS